MNVALSPGTTATSPGVPSIEKSVTVIVRSTGSEKPRPLLLADTLTDDVPKAQVIVDPGAIPQSPVQFNRVNAQLFGSETVVTHRPAQRVWPP